MFDTTDPHNHEIAAWAFDHAVAFLVACFAVTAAAVRAAHAWVTGRLDGISHRVDEHDEQIAAHDKAIAGAAVQHHALEDRLARIESVTDETRDLTMRIAGKLGVE